jgi:hypothetical protein
VGEGKRVVEERWEFELWEVTNSYEFMDRTYYDWRTVYVELEFVDGCLRRVAVRSALWYAAGVGNEYHITCYPGEDYGERCTDFALGLAERAFKEMDVESVRKEVHVESYGSWMEYTKRII